MKLSPTALRKDARVLVLQSRQLVQRARRAAERARALVQRAHDSRNQSTHSAQGKSGSKPHS